MLEWPEFCAKLPSLQSCRFRAMLKGQWWSFQLQWAPGILSMGCEILKQRRSVTNLSYLRYKDKEAWERCFMPLPCHFAKIKFGFPDHCQANFSKFCQAPAELDLQYWTCSVPAQKAKSAGWGAPGFKTNSQRRELQRQSMKSKSGGLNTWVSRPRLGRDV